MCWFVAFVQDERRTSHITEIPTGLEAHRSIGDELAHIRGHESHESIKYQPRDLVLQHKDVPDDTLLVGPEPMPQVLLSRTSGSSPANVLQQETSILEHHSGEVGLEYTCDGVMVIAASGVACHGEDLGVHLLNRVARRSAGEVGSSALHLLRPLEAWAAPWW
jgi:hypothetical protein